MKMAVVQSSINGKWNYCPEAARQLLRLEFADDSIFDTPDEAIACARSDNSIPPRATFTVYETPLQASMRPANRDYAPRNPTDTERAEISAALCDYAGLSPEEAGDVLAGSRIAVFDHYITDCPGYSGRVAVAVHSGGPECVDVFTWQPKCKRITTDGEAAAGQDELARSTSSHIDPADLQRGL